MSALTQSVLWQDLQREAQRCRSISLRDKALDGSVVPCGGLRLDYSRQLLDRTVLQKLVDLAGQQRLTEWRDRMFTGEAINHTEGRAALHTALRLPPGHENSRPQVHTAREKIYEFAEKVRQGIWKGATGKCITDVVNIGIGGSDLGPKMVTEALRPFHDRELKFHFVSNVDSTHLVETLLRCHAETTLFVVASKTFTTIETIVNATTARDWVEDMLGPNAVPKHFVAVSSAREKVEAFGINPENMFEFWDWVGGRYSVWSAIGLSVILAIGPKQFDQLLAGAYEMDCHFRQAPLLDNMPVLMGLIGVWNRNFMDCPALAVLPYDQYLQHFPAYLQQLDMESNGKFVDRDGHAVDYQTGPIIFGDVGTNGQHAFYQLLHQGTTIVPCEFIAVHRSQNPRGEHHAILLSNALAQPDALAVGRNADEAGGDLYRVFPGNRPSLVLHIDELTPLSLGQLIALYEHKVFVQSVIWNLNAFDQFGVELGKEMAQSKRRAE